MCWKPALIISVRLYIFICFFCSSFFRPDRPVSSELKTNEGDRGSETEHQQTQQRGRKTQKWEVNRYQERCVSVCVGGGCPWSSEIFYFYFIFYKIVKNIMELFFSPPRCAAWTRTCPIWPRGCMTSCISYPLTWPCGIMAHLYLHIPMAYQ